jgi:hypothetical protein
LARCTSGIGSFSSNQPPFGCTEMVPLPSGYAASPSAVRNQRAASHRRRHRGSVSPAVSKCWRVWRSRRPPRTTLTRPFAIRTSIRARRAVSRCRRRCFCQRSVWLGWPRTRPARPPTGLSGALEGAGSPLEAGQPAPPVGCGSRAAMVLGGAGDRPAQRLDEAAVSDRFLQLRSRSPQPTRQRSAKSRPASRPRCSPTSRSTISSAAEGRSRVRMRTPAGDATTNGAVMARRWLGIEAGGSLVSSLGDRRTS